MPAERRSQRIVLSCMDCTRRKTRCSKTIPCTSCIDRGQAQTCRREPVAVVKKVSRRHDRILSKNRHNQTAKLVGGAGDLSSIQGVSDHGQRLQTGDERAAYLSEADQPTRNTESSSSLPNIETVATLEFLTHGRRNILSRPSPPYSAPDEPSLVSSNSPLQHRWDPTWDTIISFKEAQDLLNYHRERIAWMHNVVHMPTLLEELESNWSRATCDETWIALYYAILCTTLHHADESDITGLGISITASADSARVLYDKSVSCLFKANFMAKHTVYSLQTVCILMQVAHNIDQSDFTCVLISAAIRISQCLNIHRLGPDQPASIYHGQPEENIVRTLIEREVKKRVWWFLVRQDWLQIPFQNTYLIHATQFNTPFPLNCYEDPALMIRDSKVVSQPDETYTQCSYTHTLSKVAVVIWKQQDRTCSEGHPKDQPDGLRRIYDQVLWADQELNRIYATMPSFLKPGSRHPTSETSYPSYVSHLASISMLSMAHKYLSIHRHFILQSFKDKHFAYTRFTCIAIAKKCVLDVQAWPDDSFCRICQSMWTVSSHLVACCITLILATLFKGDNEIIHDNVELRQVAELGRELLGRLESLSSIARRGGILLDVLLRLGDQTSSAELSLSNVIRQVSSADENQESRGLLETDQFILQMGSNAWDEIFETMDFNVTDLLGEAGMADPV
ncbi:hypothetical protein NM208_g506 [Fusarium decemcellulare]|uniref:Uncharacterized protein n=2 Tax=Fusarium decemcellulare TaxID=57161 RepID=A0ACC1SRK1_9HYPO|nr:hypothetical protein NM208_g2732 [Fusarium decemcellulare]KAJ3549452.1 hypothetical protein NM208_g506 [Fusarium decemcellulare]